MIAGCNKDGGKSLDQAILGEWHSTSISVNGDIYLSFSEDKTYELYQKIGEGRYRKYEGTYTVTGSVVSGKYSDGEKWGSDYEASFEGEKLILTAQNGSSEVCTYEKKALPDTDKAEAILVTRSAQDGPRFL